MFYKVGACATRVARLRFSASIRTKIESILLAVTIFMILGGLTSLALQRPLRFGILNTCLTGIGVGLFEEFFVQSRAGRRMRNMQPLLSLLLYAVTVTVLSFFVVNITHIILGSVQDLPYVYRRLPFIIPLFLGFSLVGVVVMRAVHFIGPATLFHLMVGTYHRPISEAKILMFIDINGSTALAQRLGAFEIRALVGKFLFDVSKPIADSGGEIHLYKGDGLIAVWDWDKAVRGHGLLQAVDAIFSTVRREEAAYLQLFGVVPTFRIGIHGGNVVVCEQGDTKRAIGIYGEVINVAARMEDAAKQHGIACVISEDIVLALKIAADQIADLGREYVRGMPLPIRIFHYRPKESR